MTARAGWAGGNSTAALARAHPRSQRFAQHFLDVRDPKVELLLGIIRVFSGDAGPYSLALASEFAHVSRDQLILRLEMTIERHLVGERRFRDGLDTDWMNSISIEKIAGDQQDPFARWLRTEIGRI